MSLKEDFLWRYATKAMNGETIPQEKIDYILNAIQQAPTSSGLQAFKVFVVKSQELKDKIRPIAFNQSVISDCSHLLIFTAWDNYTEENLGETFDFMASVRGSNEMFENYRKNLTATYIAKDKEENFNHTARNVYIPFSFAIMAAAEQKIDATPVEGFIPAKLDELLGFEEKGLKSVLLLPLGYRDEENDWNLPQPKVRKPIETLVEELD